MFTGLIEDVGTIRRVERRGELTRIEIETALDTATFTMGESIACSGACLTVVHLAAGRFTVELSGETLMRTTFKQAKAGEPLNLERALRLGDRLGGHFVLGHVDGVGRIERRTPHGETLELTVQCTPELLGRLVAKGSVALDGISLTVNEVDARTFSLTLIPHTLTRTTLAQARVGQEVNLELDILGKYVERLLALGGPLDKEFLAKHGFAQDKRR